MINVKLLLYMSIKRRLNFRDYVRLIFVCIGMPLYGLEVRELPSAGGMIEDGYVYTVVSNTVLKAEGKSGLAVAEGAKAAIYIPRGIALECIGGDAKNIITPGMAGIHLPSNSVLSIVGAGTLKARGGRALDGQNGLNGLQPHLVLPTVSGGNGGDGGNGGAGAGAGIGTNGGNGGRCGRGGVGAEYTFSGLYRYKIDRYGTVGGIGINGEGSLMSGELYLLGKTMTECRGGDKGDGGIGGLASFGSYLRSEHLSGGAGGGGGGGAAGGAGYSVGTGGPGGGGGGGGCGGGLHALGGQDVYYHGSGGCGGSGQSSGGDGERAVFPLGENQIFAGMPMIPGPPKSDGGSSGNRGASGRFYKMDSAFFRSIESLGAPIVKCEGRVAYLSSKVTFNSNFNGGSLCETNLYYGVSSIKDLIFPVQELRNGYIFRGYTTKNTLVTDELGNPNIERLQALGLIDQSGFWICATNTTFCAFWKQVESEITVDPVCVVLPYQSAGFPVNVTAPSSASWFARSDGGCKIVSEARNVGPGVIWCEMADDSITSGRIDVIETRQLKDNFYRGLIVWIKDQASEEGNENRSLTYPLSRRFDGDFANTLVGSVLPNKADEEVSIAFSFRIEELNRLNPLLDLGDSSWVVNESNLLCYHRKSDNANLGFDVIEANVWYTLAFTYRSTGDCRFYLGKRGECLTGRSQKEYGNEVYSTMRNYLRLGACTWPVESNLRGGMISDLRIWTRALTDSECRNLDVELEHPLLEDYWIKGCANDFAWDFMPLDGNAFQLSQTNTIPKVVQTNLSGWTPTDDRFGTGSASIMSDGNGRIVLADFSNRFAETETDATYAFWIRVDALPKGEDVEIMHRAFYEGDKMVNNAKLELLLTPKGTLKVRAAAKNVKEIDKAITINEWHHLAVVGVSGCDVCLYIDGQEWLSMTNGSKIGYVPTNRIAELSIGGWCGATDGLSIIHGSVTAADVSNIYAQQKACVTSCTVTKIRDDCLLRELSNEATTDDIRAALFAAKDINLQSRILTANEYQRFRRWASGVTNSNSEGTIYPGYQTVLDSRHAWLSYMLDADAVLQDALSIDKLRLDTMKATDGVLSFDVSLKDVRVGANAKPEYLSSVFGVEGSSVLDESAFSGDTIHLSNIMSVDGGVRIVAEPINRDTRQFFMRTHIKNPDREGRWNDNARENVGAQSRIQVAKYSGYIGTSNTLMWKNVRLENILSFRGSLGGAWINNGESLSAGGYNIKRTLSGVSVQFQAANVKCVSVEFTQVGNDVYGRCRYANYTGEVSIRKLGMDFDLVPRGETPVSVVDTDGGRGYGVKDITIEYFQ